MKRAKVKRHNRYTLYMTDEERDRLNLIARWYDTTVAGALRQLIDREACLMTVRPIVVADVDVELYDTIERYAALVTAGYGLGRVVAFSPHPEGSSGFIPRDRLCINATHWANGGSP